MKKELEAIGHGYKANCWCTHGCWMMSSITFNPGKMISMLIKANKETKQLARLDPVTVDEAKLRELETRYKLDIAQLERIGLTAKKVNAA
jgi:hypothetical protein